jgi:hypothetical protein
MGGPSLAFLTMAFKEYCDTSGSGQLPFETVVENTTVFPEELEILTEETCGTGFLNSEMGHPISGVVRKASCRGQHKQA